MDDKVDKSIAKLALTFAQQTGYLSDKQVSKAGYDKTYTGVVIDKVTKSDGSTRWLIGCDNGSTYEFRPEDCNIKNVGQKVRIYVPNHNYMNKYIEVIGDGVMIPVTDLGDGLYQLGDDGGIFCIYKLLGTDVKRTEVTYLYERYKIIVSWTETKINEVTERRNPQWTRVYPEGV